MSKYLCSPRSDVRNISNWDFWLTVGPRSKARVVKRMHRVPLRTCSSHVMPYFGGAAKVYVYQSHLSLLAAVVPRTCHVTSKTMVFSPISTRRLYSNGCERSWKKRSKNSMQLVGLRRLSWMSKTNSRSAEFDGFSDSQEEEAKAAILDKVMKGRQPTDLMLRCE